MSPSETSRRPDLLEHPEEAFSYFEKRGVERVVCQEKHMGSRAVIVVCRDPQVVRERFGIATDDSEVTGACYTRTGRQFFEDLRVEGCFLDRLSLAIERSGLWEELRTSWICLDCELMPWSAKAQELLKQQYAAVAAAATAATTEALVVLEQARSRGAEIEDLLVQQQERREMVQRYRAAYRRFCWPVNSLTDLKLAPFHLLASEGAVHVDKDHLWHMATLQKLCHQDEELLVATPHLSVDLQNPESREAGIGWWEDLTSRGGEGMVIKPLDFVRRWKEDFVLSALKCRGREYLRIIYGPEYTASHNLERLRERGLSRKRSLAIREFALGIEALERFVRREPLRRIHECVFGVLALESEPIDPRL